MKKIALIFALLCSGCANHIIRVQSSWYIVGGETDSSKTYLVLLNLGNTAVDIERVIANPVRDEFSFFEDRYRGSWDLQLQEKLEPGQLRVIDAGGLSRQEQHWRCVMPVEVDLQLKDSKRLLVTEYHPTLPGTLPWEWEKNCLQPGRERR